MNTSKIALYTPDDESHIFSGPEAIIDMFDHTDEDGILFIPKWPYDNNYDEEESFYKCRMSWNRTDAEKAVADFEALYEALETIAKIPDHREPDFDVKSLPSDLQTIWNTYLRDFDADDSFDMDLVMDIYDRLDTVAFADSIARKIEKGSDVSEEEYSLYNECKDTFVSESEEALFDEYLDALYKEAEKRVGESLAAYDVINRTRRLCRLISLGAPDFILRNEASFLAQAMVIHDYCNERETVNTVE